MTTHGPGTVAAREVTPARRWAWVGVLVGGVALYLAVERALVTTQNPNYIPSALLLGSIVVPAAFVTYIYGQGSTWTMPAPALAIAAVAGGVIGVVVAGILEYETLRDQGVLSTMGIGAIEESSKLIVPLALLVALPRHRSEADGLVVGVTVGASFAALETMGYGFTTLLASGGNVGEVEDLLLLRGLLSPAGHMAWTGLACAALYRAWSEWQRGQAGLVFLVTFAVVVVLHGLWDGLGTLPAYIVIGVISLGLLALEVYRTLHQHPRAGPGDRPAAAGRLTSLG